MKKIDLGPVGLNVARNVRRFRGDRDISYAELSRRLTELNRPIPPLGLRHLEAGKRRVDVDELVALAIALDAAPIVLLLPTEADQMQEMASPEADQMQEMYLLLIGGGRGIDRYRALTRRPTADGDD